MNIVFLTGAGISVPSGIPDFRSSGGLWNNYKIEEVASIESLKRNPELVYKFYQERFEEYSKCNPNEAHKIISDLQNKHNVVIITQNVDDLHEKAGSKIIYHMHGDLHHVRNIHDNSLKLRNEIQDISEYRPNVVFFEESIMYQNHIFNVLKKTEIICYVGTSNTVYPANMYYSLTQSFCKKLIFNKELPFGVNGFDSFIQGDVTNTLCEYFNNF
jgi:NAD-dependent deacetylase